MNNQIELLSCEEHAIFLGSLRPETSADDIASYFAKFGNISRAKVIYDVVTMKSKNCGIVFCSDIATVDNILKQTDHYLLGKKVRVSRADSQKKGTKKVNTQSLFVSVIGGQASLDSILAFFASFGLIRQFHVLKAAPYPWQAPENLIIQFANQESVAHATKSLDPYIIDGSQVDCLPVDLPSSSEDCQPPPEDWKPETVAIEGQARMLPIENKSGWHQKKSKEKGREGALEVMAGLPGDARSRSTNYVLLVEFEPDPLFRLFCDCRSDISPQSKGKTISKT